MMLFILRHGQAEPMRHDDATRALVARGVVQVQQTAAWLQSRGFKPGQVFASPYLRAQQTAQTLLQHNNWSLTIHTENRLTPDNEPALTASWIDTLPEQNYLFAAHLPLVARLTDYLTRQRVDFAPGSIAVLSKQASSWCLHDFFTPEQ